jgi:hypothetical protein
VQIDPQLGYGTTAWWLEYATALKLVNWPDRPGLADIRLVLEAASGLAVSNRGKTYTFVIRKSLRFSDGSPSTTAAPRKSRVTAKGYRLVIRLTRPDCTFLSKLTMPFFQATSRTLPLSREVESAYPSAARVHEACPELGDEAAAQPLLPGSRPRHLAGVDVSWNLNLRVACNQDFGQSFCNLDELNDQFLVSESRGCWHCEKVRRQQDPLLVEADAVRRLAPLQQHPRDLQGRTRPFGAPLAGRSTAPTRPRCSRLYASSPWTHMLPPRFPGSIGTKCLQPYFAKSNIVRARKLAKGHFRSGKVVILVGSGREAQPSADLVRRDLIRMGFRPGDVTYKTWPSSIGVPPPTDWDVIPNLGWCADYPDPYDFFVPFLEPESPEFGPAMVIDSKAYRRRKIAAAARSSATGGSPHSASSISTPAASSTTASTGTGASRRWR